MKSKQVGVIYPINIFIISVIVFCVYRMSCNTDQMYYI